MKKTSRRLCSTNRRNWWQTRSKLASHGKLSFSHVWPRSTPMVKRNDRFVMRKNVEFTGVWRNSRSNSFRQCNSQMLFPTNLFITLEKKRLRPYAKMKQVWCVRSGRWVQAVVFYVRPGHLSLLKHVRKTEWAETNRCVAEKLWLQACGYTTFLEQHYRDGKYRWEKW